MAVSGVGSVATELTLMPSPVSIGSACAKVKVSLAASAVKVSENSGAVILASQAFAAAMKLRSSTLVAAMPRP